MIMNVLSLITLLTSITLSSGKMLVTFESSDRGYIVKEASADGMMLQAPSGKHIVLYSSEKPSHTPIMPKPYADDSVGAIKDRTYSSVALNTAGDALMFYPDRLVLHDENHAVFRYDCELFELTDIWYVKGDDICLEQKLRAKVEGFYSIQSPALSEFDKDSFVWAMVPGYYHSNYFNSDFHTAYNYGIGLPDHPAVLFEATCTTLTSIIQDAQGLTLAVSASPGQSRDPWRFDKNTNGEWHIGVSLIGRDGTFTPAIHKPVLGEEGSLLHSGEDTGLKTVYTLRKSDWYPVYSYVAHDLNCLDEQVSMRRTEYSLSTRIDMLCDHILDDETSRWRAVEYNGKILGAQDYLGAVKNSDKDAMKNADYGTMWMVGHLSGNKKVLEERLPQALNFKFANQGEDGATLGQYFLYKSQQFTEEWGHYTEPMANTFYMLCDMGNISLFEPENQEIKDRVRKAADKLLSWMHDDGHWEVAYDNLTGEPRFTDIQDLRPTFYGLLIAYRVCGDKKYLEGAIKGGDWLLENAVRKGQYIGVCGDTRFAPDFATAQTAQAFYDLYNVTGDDRYLDAYREASKVYTTHIFTHPFPGDRIKIAGEKIRECRPDHAISQVGMNFEHGGTFGSANTVGPILLASHAGMFVRQAAMTGDELMLDMARLAVLGRDAFINKTTGTASYYWYAMNRGAGPYPHHAWWQIGWMMDYLIAEANYRSGGEIDFPGGFFTPKVGPHRPYGFAPGQIYGKKVNLTMKKGLVKLDNPYVEYLTATDMDGKKLYVILMNNSTVCQAYSVESCGKTCSGSIPAWGMEVKTMKIK